MVKEYQVIGRKRPSEDDTDPVIYRMRIFADTSVHAKSHFWYFLSKGTKIKKATGEILSINRLYEQKPTKLKNFGVLIKYNSRSGTHNLYKEFRDLTRCGAVEQMYIDMSARHRARKSTISIIDVRELSAKQCIRPNVKEFHNSKIRFPLPHKVHRVGDPQRRKRFLGSRPSTFAG